MPGSIHGALWYRFSHMVGGVSMCVTFSMRIRYQDKEYSLVKHNDPTFVVARQTPEGYLLLGPKEGEMVSHLCIPQCRRSPLLLW